MRRVERYGGLPLATIQQRWDSAMTMPAAGADGVRANDDDSTSTRATRGGDVAQGQATAGREGAPFVADTATEHARPTDAVARRADEFDPSVALPESMVTLLEARYGAEVADMCQKERLSILPYCRDKGYERNEYTSFLVKDEVLDA